GCGESSPAMGNLPGMSGIGGTDDPPGPPSAVAHAWTVLCTARSEDTSMPAAAPPVRSAPGFRPFFEPATVAVIGASRRRGRIGSEILVQSMAAPGVEMLAGVTRDPKFGH